MGFGRDEPHLYIPPRRPLQVEQFINPASDKLITRPHRQHHPSPNNTMQRLSTTLLSLAVRTTHACVLLASLEGFRGVYSSNADVFVMEASMSGGRAAELVSIRARERIQPLTLLLCSS